MDDYRRSGVGLLTLSNVRDEMRTKQYVTRIATTAIGLWLLAIVASIVLAVGWVFNLVDIVQFLDARTAPTAMFVLQCVGVFFLPLGGVLGWIN